MPAEIRGKEAQYGKAGGRAATKQEGYQTD